MLSPLKERIVQANLNAPNPILCPDLLQRLKFWHFDVDPKDKKKLVTEGEDELIELAKRLQKRFPELFVKNNKPELYNFKYTNSQRTRESARSFALGLFGQQRTSQIWNKVEPAINDTIIRVSRY